MTHTPECSSDAIIGHVQHKIKTYEELRTFCYVIAGCKIPAEHRETVSAVMTTRALELSEDQKIDEDLLATIEEVRNPTQDITTETGVL